MCDGGRGTSWYVVVRRGTSWWEKGGWEERGKRKHRQTRRGEDEEKDVLKGLACIFPDVRSVEVGRARLSAFEEIRVVANLVVTG